MKAKKWLLGCVAAAVLGMLATGCSNSMETEEEIITMKDESVGSGESGMPPEAGEGQVLTREAGELGGIAEQVQAPEHYTADFSAGSITVKVDAPLVIPDGEGFKTYRVKGRPFEQKDYEQVSHTLLKDVALWERDLEVMSDSNGMTREEIEQRIAEKESEMSEAKALGAKGISAYEANVGKSLEEEQKSLEYLYSRLEYALEEPVTVEVPAVVTVDVGDKQGLNKEAGLLSGYATVDGADYLVDLNNVFREDWHWNTFQITSKEEDTGYFLPYYSFWELSDEQKESAALSIDEIRTKAEEVVAAMGFTDFVPAGEEYFAIQKDVTENISLEDKVRKIGYGIHFTRSLDGVPVTYTREPGTTMEDGESLVWPYENLTLVYDEDGIVDFVWGNPYEIEKVSDEYLFLLPFAEIQNIFEEMIIKKYQSWVEDNSDVNMKLDFQIKEVRLGYMRVREKGNAQEASMIPVWDFMGTQSITYDGAESGYDDGSIFNSQITINALDGTIIDRGSGY